MELTSKQRSHLKGLAQTIDSTFQIGKSNLTPEITNAIGEVFNTHELVKISVLKNCTADSREMASMLADRTGSTVVQIIGRKIVLYKPFKDNPVILLPR